MNTTTALTAGTKIAATDRINQTFIFILDADAEVRADGEVSFTGSRVTKTGRVMKRKPVRYFYPLDRIEVL